MMMRMSVFREVGGYDEDLPIVFQDVDLCFKVRSQGYLIVYTPYAELYHYEGISRWTHMDELLPDMKLFFSRWRAIYGDDAEI
jgi:GT2 family glycosyltransferase